LDLNADLSAGYAAVFFWLLANKENLVAINPTAFLEIASHNYLTVRTPLIHATLVLNITPWKFTLADYQATWSLDNKSRYCHSAGYD
jgi:hypothetical protein